MERSRFDSLVTSVAQSRSRRDTLRLFGLAIIGGAGVLATDDAEARRKHRRGKKNKKGGSQTPPPPPGLALRSICTPGQSVCASGLKCDVPTTRHTCSSTVEDVDAWCCVPPGGKCTECDCCGNFYCKFDDNNNPTCQPNPEN